MRSLLSSPVKEYPQFMAALSFMPILSPDDVAGLLRSRVNALRVTVRRIEDDLEQVVGELPELFMVESQYELEMLRAELRYTEVLARRIADGTLDGVEGGGAVPPATLPSPLRVSPGTGRRRFSVRRRPRPLTEGRCSL
ncbi:hypothetical protein NKG05_09505 [Oerskovia sp. M15]